MMKNTFIITTFFLAFIHIDAQTFITPLGKTINTDLIDQFLKNEIKSTNTAGLSIAFLNDKEIIYHTNIGESKPGQKVTEHTVFEGASLSKPLFAYFVMQYIEDGLLDLDTPLYKYFPYEDIAHDERYKKITARLVLSHKTGFPNWRTDSPGDELFLDFEPGTKFQYSGEGFQYLALVLQHLLKTDAVGLQKEFHKRVAKPLGLKETRFITNDKSQKNKAQSFKNEKWEAVHNWGDQRFGAAYGIHSTAKDFSKWIMALMNKKGLNEKSYNELFKLQTKLPDDHPMRAEGVTGVALGFYQADLPFGKLYGHGGNNSRRFTSMFYFFPELNWGMVLFTNSGAGEEIGLKLLQYITSI